MELQKKIQQVKFFFPWYNGEGERLCDLPLMTGAFLNEHYYKYKPVDMCNVYETSGNAIGGARKKVFYSYMDESWWLDEKVEIFGDFLEGTEISRGIIDVGQGHVAKMAPSVLNKLNILNACLDITEPLDHHIAVLKSFKPQLLYTSPTILDSILYELSEPHLIGIKKLIIIGEIVSREWIRRVADLLKIDVHDIHINYGCTELGTLATYNHDHQMYVSVKGVVLESIESPLTNEGESMLVATKWKRELFPSLRFMTYDIVRNFIKTSYMGKTKYCFDNIVRRGGNEWKHGELISLYDIEQAVYFHLEKCVISYRIENNCLTVRLKAKDLHDDVLDVICYDINHAIPEIGIMVGNGLIPPIEVIRDNNNNSQKDWFYKKKVVIS